MLDPSKGGTFNLRTGIYWFALMCREITANF